MPATITATNGVDYHLWQARCGVKDSQSSIGFERYRNEMGSRYTAVQLYGSAAGNRDWSIGMPGLRGDAASQTLTGVDGGTFTFEEYVWDLYNWQQTTGEPFVYQDPRTDQYYFAEFTDDRLSYQRVLTRLYSTSLNISQIRVPGVSVFDPSNVSQLWAHYDPENFTGSIWPDETGNGHGMTSVSGDVQHVQNAKNGQYIVRFNAGAGSGFISSAHDLTVYDFIAVVKFRESSFTGYQGVATSDVTGAVLVGEDTEAKFFYFGENPPATYWLNGTEFSYLDMQAPMDAYGIVHIRFPSGKAITNLQFGKDRNFSDRYALMDLGDVCISDSHIPLTTVFELKEHFAAKYRVNVVS